MLEAVASVVARTSVAVPRAPQLPFWEPSTTGARETEKREDIRINDQTWLHDRKIDT